ncbi:hypothetical protein HDU76_001473, partial [Blyttiomyces sp. JEL0837]
HAASGAGGNNASGGGGRNDTSGGDKSDVGKESEKETSVQDDKTDTPGFEKHVVAVMAETENHEEIFPEEEEPDLVDNSNSSNTTQPESPQQQVRHGRDFSRARLEIGGGRFDFCLGVGNEGSSRFMGMTSGRGSVFSIPFRNVRKARSSMKLGEIFPSTVSEVSGIRRRSSCMDLGKAGVVNNIEAESASSFAERSTAKSETEHTDTSTCTDGASSSTPFKGQRSRGKIHLATQILTSRLHLNLKPTTNKILQFAKSNKPSWIQNMNIPNLHEDMILHGWKPGGSSYGSSSGAAGNIGGMNHHMGGGDYKPFVLNYTTSVLAIQFCLIEQALVRNVPWVELLDVDRFTMGEVGGSGVNTRVSVNVGGIDEDGRDGGRSGAEFGSCREAAYGLDAAGISSLISRFNQTCQWVASEIVSCPKIDTRVKVIEMMIQIAKECKELNNYSTLMQILLGLQNASVERLRKTWSRVSASSMETFQDLSLFASPFGNFKHIRSAMVRLSDSVGDEWWHETMGDAFGTLHQASSMAVTKVNSTVSGSQDDIGRGVGGAVPFIGLYLSDLVTISDVPTYVAVDSKTGGGGAGVATSTGTTLFDELRGLSRDMSRGRSGSGKASGGHSVGRSAVSPTRRKSITSIAYNMLSEAFGGKGEGGGSASSGRSSGIWSSGGSNSVGGSANTSSTSIGGSTAVVTPAMVASPISSSPVHSPASMVSVSNMSTSSGYPLIGNPSANMTRNGVVYNTRGSQSSSSSASSSPSITPTASPSPPATPPLPQSLPPPVTPTPLINFRKMRMLASVIRRFRSFQSLKLEYRYLY